MGKKILIIDDNEQDRKIMERYIKKVGYEEVSTAETGEKGLERAVSLKPDLVIIDTILPGIDGFEVCRRIKEDQTAHVPKIIITTGTVDAVDAVKARRVGADDYCVKTSDCIPLIEAIKKLM